MAPNEFDVVVWGATGFTGQLVVEYLWQSYPPGSGVTWAIAGRNPAKLDTLRRVIAGDVFQQIPVLIADSTDADSLRAMVQRTGVVCSTVGPYARYGTPLVAACVAAGTDYCDLTGEVQWMRKTIDQFQTAAEASGARIVHTCGFDSIPSDMGVFYIQQQMREKHGVYASAVKLRVGQIRGGMSGGTVESMVNMVEAARVDSSITELLSDPYSLNPRNMPRGPDGADQMSAIYDADFKQWTAPFVMAGINTRVVRRSHALMGYTYGPDFRYDEAMLMGDGPLGYAKSAAMAGATLMVMAGAAFSPTRKVLRALAPAPGEGPDRDMIENGFYELELLASHPGDASGDLRARVAGKRDPGYGATAHMLAQSALCLAKDERLVEGGLWTPTTSMGNLLLARLVAHAGMTFELV